MGHRTHQPPRKAECLYCSGASGPVTTSCIAVRENEFVIGSRGELFKCSYDVGNPRGAIGSILDVDAPNTRQAKWLYDPFFDPDCSICIALPGGMGACAAHAMSLTNRADRCSSFRLTYREQSLAFVEAPEKASVRVSMTHSPNAPCEEGTIRPRRNPPEQAEENANAGDHPSGNCGA